MARLTTRKVGAEPGLVPRLAGVGSAPDYYIMQLISFEFELKPLTLMLMLLVRRPNPHNC